MNVIIYFSHISNIRICPYFKYMDGVWANTYFKMFCIQVWFLSSRLYFLSIYCIFCSLFIICQIIAICRVVFQLVVDWMIALLILKLLIFVWYSYYLISVYCLFSDLAKWRINIHSYNPDIIMSLLLTPLSHLS